MLKNVELKPISGTFVNMLISDTGIVNAGLKEWEQDFKTSAKPFRRFTRLGSELGEQSRV